LQTSYEPESPPIAGRIAALLPQGGRVLLSGGGEALARAVAAAGVFLTERNLAFEEDGDDDATGEENPVRRFDALVLEEPPAGRQSPAPPTPLTGLLHRARNLLADKGRLFLLAPSGSDPHDHIVALSETGFVILDEDWTSGTGLFQARKESIFVTEYQDGDEEAILALFRSSFYVERSLERWRWEYAENPYGNRTISEAFAEDGALVAHYAAYPVRFHRERPEADGGPETLLAQQVGDTMTAPEVRKIGRGPTSVLARTVRHFYARFCAGRTAFNYGFNTGNIQRFSMSFVRAKRIEDAPFRNRKLKGEGVQPIRPPHWLIQKLAGYRFERVTAFDERWDELFQRVRGSYGFLIERDARYLDWRYARCPDPHYFTYAVFRRRRLVGWSVFRQIGEVGDRLFWGDALFDPRYPEAVRLLLSRALAEPAHRSTRVIETWATDRPAWWSRWVDALGFERRPEPEALGFVFVPFEPNLEGDLERELGAELYYTKGDSDLF
jgi:hypothetical protein